ncbi:MAG: DUF2062 domain-containing protein [Betaproteobacteria bacterium]|jgi:uncharacterized protein (DUF2062 family)|nr:DUF2062 domain-containing protein [Betaproteobacteria bacterium]MBK7744810.1 DUF2062 domain-containing protein [Betaproteobacteria bacterium]
MPRHLIRQFTARLQPAVDRVTSNPTLRRFVPAIADPDLWHLNRRSTARAVAIGLFCGLIPGPLQVLGAVVVCLWIRSNFPLTVITTFYTNPLTIVPLYLVAYQYGRLFFPGARADPPAFQVPSEAGLLGFLPALSEWMLGLGKPLAVGIVLLATTLAAIGWVVVRVGWRCHVVRAWRRRAQLRRRAP